MDPLKLLPGPVAFIWGVATLALFTLRALLDRETWRSPTLREQEKLRKAYHDLWSVTTPPLDRGIQHNFITLSTCLQLHYLSPAPNKASLPPKQYKQLIVFLHGFPDSCYVFSRFVSSDLLQSTGAKLVSVDLPGFGGSDGLKRYGAQEVMNAVVEGIGRLKQRYLPSNQDDGECVLVGHDWGAVITCRIAAETVGLVDKVVVINGTYVPLMGSNVASCLRKCAKSLSMWIKGPLNFGLLRSAFVEIIPAIVQLTKSNYIFMFRLPSPILSKNFSFVIDTILRLLHENGPYRHILNTPSATSLAVSPDSQARLSFLAWSRALVDGPSREECKPLTGSTKGRSVSYGSTVVSHSTISPPGDWHQRIRLYREGLMIDAWSLRPEVRELGIELTDTAGDKNDGEGAFRCPMTLVFGVHDLAFDTRIAVDGIERLFFKTAVTSTINDVKSIKERKQESHVVRLKHCGHWSLLEPVGARVVEQTLYWLVTGSTSDSPVKRQEVGLEANLFKNINNLAGEATVATYDSRT